MTDNSKPDFWQMQSNLDIQGLIDALSSDEKHFRQRAATALRSMKAVAAIPALKEAFQREEDAETSMAIATAIESLTDATRRAASDANNTPVDQLVKQLQHSNRSDQVMAAANKLGELGDKVAVEPLILAFNNPRHTIHVRLAIAEALLKLESAPATVALLANLRHSDWHIRRNGAAILGQLQAEWAIEPLARTLADPHPVVRRTALAALKHIGTPESRKALAKYVPTNRQTANTDSETPKEVSGIEVKRPGQQQENADQSSLLKRLREKKQGTIERARRGTQPLEDHSQKPIEATQPIRGNMLDQLDALLDDDLDDE
ncbi:MAG: HEAT repeat domain-containing protein [Anaerolineae bacterium]